MLKPVITALVLCIIEITVIVVASPLAKPSLVLRFLPEDVRLAAKDHPEPEKGKQMIAHLLLALFLAAMLAGIIYLGIDGIRNGYGFWMLTLRFIILLYVMKAFDIIVQDHNLSVSGHDNCGVIHGVWIDGNDEERKFLCQAYRQNWSAVCLS